MKISLIIPVYNFGKSLLNKINLLKDFSISFPYDLEILFVDDGSTDSTVELLKTISSPFKHIRLEKNQGKGAAVKRGIAEADGEYIFFTDADLPYDLAVMNEAVNALKDGCDVVLGSRELPGSKSSCSRNIDRKLGSKVFSKIANVILLEKVEDTQCGFKGFKSDIAKKIFQDVSTKGFAFDVEVIYLAQKANSKIHLIPVHLIEDADSSVHFIRDSIKMFWQLVKLYTIIKKRQTFEFVRYIFVGVFNTVLNIAIFNLLMWSTGINQGPYVVFFSFVAFIIVMTQAFFTNALWVFKKKEHIKHTNYKKFFAVSGSIALINLLIIHALVNIIGSPASINSQLWANLAVMSTIVVSVFGNFLGYKFIVFK